MTTSRIDKMRASIKERQASGLYFGRTPVFKVRGKHCKVCDKWFRYKYYAKQGERKVCGPACARKAARETRRKVPDSYELLYDLYWNQNLSTVQIATQFLTDHSVIKRHMIRLGIPRRKVGVSRYTSCIVEGCNGALFKIRHPTNGSLYGRRCLPHWAAHRSNLAKGYWLKIRRWNQLGFNVNRRGETDIQGVIEDAVPKHLPYEIREEVCQEVALQLLLRKTNYRKLRDEVQRLIKHFFKEYQDKFGDLSLDAPMGEDGITLGELLDDRGKVRRVA